MKRAMWVLLSCSSMAVVACASVPDSAEPPPCPGPDVCAAPSEDACDGADCGPWSRVFGGHTNAELLDIEASPDGSVVLLGRFSGALDFRGISLRSAGRTDLFLARIDPQSDEIHWAKRFGDTAPQAAGRLAVDPSGNILYAGALTGTLDFGDGPLSSDGPLDDAFLVKLDPDGNALWSKRFGDIGDQGITDLDTDDRGDVYLTGYSKGTIDFGDGPLTSTMFHPFVAKISASGKQALWSATFGDPCATAFGRAIRVTPTGQVVIAGTFGADDIDFGGAVFSDTTPGGPDLFVAAFEPSSALPIWSRAIPAAAPLIITDIAAGPDGQIYLASEGTGPVDFGSGVSRPRGGTDIHVAAFDVSGDPMWSKAFGSPANEGGPRLGITNGQIFLAVHGGGDMDFGGGPLAATEDSGDVFLAQMSFDGAHLRSRRFGPASASAPGSDSVRHSPVLAPLPSGDIVFGCSFQGSIDFGDGPLFASRAAPNDLVLTLLAP